MKFNIIIVVFALLFVSIVNTCAATTSASLVSAEARALANSVAKLVVLKSLNSQMSQKEIQEALARETRVRNNNGQKPAGIDPWGVPFVILITQEYVCVISGGGDKNANGETAVFYLLSLKGGA